VGQVADTSLAALQKEMRRLSRSPFWQRYLFRRDARGLHGVHSPLAWELSQQVWLPTAPGLPLPARLEAFFSDWSFGQFSVLELPSALDFLTQNPQAAVFVTGLPANREDWLKACAAEPVNMAIDCFDCGLLIRSRAVFQKQYLRQRHVG
jgi:hypothetical protein